VFNDPFRFKLPFFGKLSEDFFDAKVAEMLKNGCKQFTEICNPFTDYGLDCENFHLEVFRKSLAPFAELPYMFFEKLHQLFHCLNYIKQEPM
jgi:hypothetical protein